MQDAEADVPENEQMYGVKGVEEIFRRIPADKTAFAVVQPDQDACRNGFPFCAQDADVGDAECDWLFTEKPEEEYHCDPDDAVVSLKLLAGQKDEQHCGCTGERHV